MNNELMITPPYIGVIEGHSLSQHALAKIYFASICGRINPRVITEWDKTNLEKGEVIEKLDDLLLRNHRADIPHFVVSLPHNTVIFSWGDPRERSGRETNVYRVGQVYTKQEGPFKLNSTGGILPQFIFCPIEGHVIGGEMEIRAASRTFEEYMSRFVPNTELAVANPNMFRDYLLRTD